MRHFYSRHPYGQRRSMTYLQHGMSCDFYSRHLHRWRRDWENESEDVSIHATHTGSDRYRKQNRSLAYYFYSRYPCGQRRRLLATSPMMPRFLFTLPVWAATRPMPARAANLRYFYSRYPCGQRHALCAVYAQPYRISIHATRVGSDLRPYQEDALRRIFLFTPPIRAATPHINDVNRANTISIHATRAGGDGALCLRI